MMKFRITLIFLICLLVTLPVAAYESGGMVQFGSDLHIPEDMEVDGDAVTIFGDLEIDGRIDGSAVAIFGDLNVTGDVEDVVCVFGKVILHDGAKVNGDLVSVMGGIERLGNTIVSGDVTNVGPSFVINNKIIQYNKITRYFPMRFLYNDVYHWRFAGWFSGLIFSILIALLLVHFILPNLEKINGVIIDDPLRIGLKGLLFSFLSIMLIVILSITIIGIPVAMILGFLLWVANLVGIIAIELLIGKRIAEQMDKEVTPYMAVVIGVFAVQVVTILPVVGWLIKLILGVLGFGGIIQTKFGTGKTWVK